MSNSKLTHTYSSNRVIRNFEESANYLIFGLETRRYDAMLSGDVKELNSIFSDSLNYMHSNAVPDNKDEYINKISTGRLAYLSINAFDVDIAACDDHALVFGHLRAEVVSDGTPRNLHCKFIAVWSFDGEAWRFKAFAPTPVPSAS